MAALFTDQRGFVAKVAARVLKGSADLEDVVQDVFVAVVACAGKLDRIEALGAWLHAVTVKQARTTIRRRRRRRSMEAGDEHLEAAAAIRADPDPVVATRGLCAALVRIPAKERTAWVLRYVEERSLQEVAARCNCSLATAKRRIAAANAVARRAIEDL